MRNIKFRAWDKDLKLMHTCGQDVHDSMTFDENNIAQYYNLQNGCGSPTTYELMQYTGLHDKNGKEIYDGDIVRIIVNNNIEKICKVEFKNGIFGVMFSKNKELTAFPHFCNTTFEVIGNEYDNPELLGGE